MSGGAAGTEARLVAVTFLRVPRQEEHKRSQTRPQSFHISFFIENERGRRITPDGTNAVHGEPLGPPPLWEEGRPQGKARLMVRLEPLAEVEGALLVVEVLHLPHPKLLGLLGGSEHFCTDETKQS